MSHAISSSECNHSCPYHAVSPDQLHCTSWHCTRTTEKKKCTYVCTIALEFWQFQPTFPHAWLFDRYCVHYTGFAVVFLCCCSRCRYRDNRQRKPRCTSAAVACLCLLFVCELIGTYLLIVICRPKPLQPLYA